MTAQTPKHDPTPAFARQVIDLYAEALSEAHFPDLDLALLQAEQDKLQSAQLELEQAEAVHAKARSARDAQADMLSVKAERALAYARVFAAGNDELSARVAEFGRRKLAVAAPEGESTPARKRKRKGERLDGLFSDEMPATEADAPQPELQ